MPDFDTLIIGAGTAGCRIARRLAQNSRSSTRTTIGLIEAGSTYQPIQTRVPAWYPWCFGSKVDWAWQTVPQVELNNRSLRWPRGRLLGGSGAINALIDIQSSRSDWDRWGWQWADSRLTSDLPPHPEVQHSPHPWTYNFLSSCQQFGLKRIERLEQSGKDLFGTFMLARSNGLRAHTAQGLKDHNNIQILSGVIADEILFKGSTAIGVRLAASKRSALHESSQAAPYTKTLTANRIILCAGTLGSPELLLRSGIGQIDELREIGIECRIDLAGVGKNLQDHLVMPIVYRTRQPHGLPRIHGPLARQALRNRATGSLTSNIAEATALIGEEHSLDADFQIHFTPNHYWKYPFRQDQQSHLSLNVSDLHPCSRGEVRLERRYASNRLQLNIDPRYLSDSQDILRLSQAVSIAIQIAKQPSLAELIQEPLAPEPSNPTEASNLIRKYTQSIYHPIGTCAMQSPLAGYAPVVNEQFQVLGVENLWVADASVLPDQPSCNPNRTVILIADRLGALLS